MSLLGLDVYPGGITAFELRGYGHYIALGGRKKSNLARTLKAMSRYGLVELRAGQRGRLIPRVAKVGVTSTGGMMIWLHLTATLLALGLGTANLALAKGTPRHKIFGWTWIVAMLFVTIVSIRTGRVRTHAGFMIGTMIGVIVAGGFALMPGRFIGHVLGY